MFLTDDEELYKRAALERDHGRHATRAYYNIKVAHKYMPPNLTAAVGCAQMERLDELVQRKQNHLAFYKQALGSRGDLWFNSQRSDEVNGAWITAVAWSPYVIDHGDKNDIIAEFKKRGCPARPFFYPLSLLPAYNEFNEYKDRNSNAYSVAPRGINLPGALSLTSEQLDFVANTAREVFKL